MIDFEIPLNIKQMQKMLHEFSANNLRPISREFDEKEHEKPWDLINMVHAMTQGSGFTGSIRRRKQAKEAEKKDAGPAMGNVMAAILAEELTWGDAGLMLCMSGPGLGGAAIQATGTEEQQERFLSRFEKDKPIWGAMAITEPGCGSDSAAITTTAVRDGDHWVLNGEKIFVTSGLMAAQESEGFVVVWATVDKSAGRAGIKAFVVEKGTPGMKVTKLEHKLGIRASDTASVVFEDCRIPYDNILGSPEVIDKTKDGGFKGVMATFDATRPMIAAMALGVGRAALEFTRDALEKDGIQIRYGASPFELTAVERDFMDMETNLHAARLLTWRACWMLDNKIHNNLEAAMAKAKAGLAVTRVTQKAVEILGPLGYSRKNLLEKWIRDAKINDIFEGTGQIQMLIVARRVLDFTRKELK
ncbi:MAG: acyl-CoA dehydrogenase family protein [Deltaproteobacteria bacterium]|nr:MAG: acyl-CoA dehydrogenase family protein [Deltaproteobacteria bacterium]